jgi:hypothetical protein
VVKIVPGVGHFLHNESDDVLAIYRDFLSLPSERQLSLQPNRQGSADFLST